MMWARRKEKVVVTCPSGLSYDFTDTEYIQVHGPELDHFRLQGYEILESEENPNAAAKPAKAEPPKPAPVAAKKPRPKEVDA